MSETNAPSEGSPGSLLQAFEGRFQIGCAVGGTLPGCLSSAEQQLLLQHFNVLTPENCMKTGLIHPEPERYDFEAGDALVGCAEQHGMAVVGHCLSWHAQAPEWFLAPGLGRGEALQQLRAHIHAVAGRYTGRIQGWDVVNEAIADSGEFLRDTPGLRTIGADYIERAFEFAREAAPDAELYYNDYNIEQPLKRDRTLRLLERLQGAGLRLDGVGIQGHWMLDKVPFDDVAAAIEAYRALGLNVMITELDIDVVERPDSGADVLAHKAYAPNEDIFRDGCPEPVLDRQAEQYARLFEIFAGSPAVTRVTFWGLHDGGSWLNTWPGKRTNHPLLFDRACHPKPSFHSVVEVGRKLARRSRA